MAAVALGATLIEKHYTLDNKLPGPDHAFAITAEELKSMVKAIRDCEASLGSGKKMLQPEEMELKTYAQRAIQATTNILIGEALSEGKNIQILRPGKQRQGVHPKLLPHIEGKTAKRRIPLGDGIQTNDF